jgi:hypothetical protein
MYSTVQVTAERSFKCIACCSCQARPVRCSRNRTLSDANSNERAENPDTRTESTMAVRPAHVIRLGNLATARRPPSYQHVRHHITCGVCKSGTGLADVMMPGHPPQHALLSLLRRLRVGVTCLISHSSSFSGAMFSTTQERAVLRDSPLWHSKQMSRSHLAVVNFCCI